MLKVTTPGDREIVMTREFDAPRRLVFEAITKPELVRRWLGVMPGWTWDVCEIDLRVGGTYRYAWSGPDGVTMGIGGTYLEVNPPERIVATEKFDEAWYEGDAQTSMVLTETDGRTTLALTVRYASREVRDAVLKSSGAVEGVGAGFDLLAVLLSSMKS